MQNIQNVKEEAIKIINQMPDDATTEQIMENLYFKIVVDAGLKQPNIGEGIPHEEIKKRFLYND
ncbi:MAG: hypothetical protein H7A23_16225 [Leptospiraceae bacterium]|nr:hypothetical protein [Leptospiraceae bacterium]MCP5496094.1 hypothetical protein [Leptospiraceae bacterium]